MTISDAPQMLTRCWVKNLLLPLLFVSNEAGETVLVFAPPFIAPTSKRSKPARVITAALKEGLLIISPLSLLQPRILDVSLCRGARTGDSVLLATICSNAQKMCCAEWRGSLLKTRHPSGRKRAASSSRRRGREEVPSGGRHFHRRPGPPRE